MGLASRSRSLWRRSAAKSRHSGGAAEGLPVDCSCRRRQGVLPFGGARWLHLRGSSAGRAAGASSFGGGDALAVELVQEVEEPREEDGPGVGRSWPVVRPQEVLGIPPVAHATPGKQRTAERTSQVIRCGGSVVGPAGRTVVAPLRRRAGRASTLILGARGVEAGVETGVETGWKGWKGWKALEVRVPGPEPPGTGLPPRDDQWILTLGATEDPSTAFENIL